jgi:hypothetical protein
MVHSKSIRPARDELRDVITALRGLQSTLAVAVGALRHQNADIDADIANLLQRSVGSPLEDCAQRLEAIATRLPRPPLRKR